MSNVRARNLDRTITTSWAAARRIVSFTVLFGRTCERGTVRSDVSVLGGPFFRNRFGAAPAFPIIGNNVEHATKCVKTALAINYGTGDPDHSLGPQDPRRKERRS